MSGSAAWHPSTMTAEDARALRAEDTERARRAAPSRYGVQGVNIRHARPYPARLHVVNVPRPPSLAERAAARKMRRAIARRDAARWAVWVALVLVIMPAAVLIAGAGMRALGAVMAGFSPL